MIWSCCFTLNSISGNKMKKVVKQLKQPARYTHQLLSKGKGQEGSQGEESGERKEESVVGKEKKIEKERYVRKVINKPNEPSALRLEQINQTFNNLAQKSQAFLGGLHINHALLAELKQTKEKFTCGCGKRVKFYCLKCGQCCNKLQLPPLQLPLSLHIIHHLSEKINKSSVAPLRFLTNQVAFYPFSSKEGEKDAWNQREVFSKLPPPQQDTYILYPHKDSQSLSEVQGPIGNLLLLDCTWFQTDQIIDSLSGLGYKKFIRLQGYESVFWRYNHYGEAALSSAQAVMHFFREYQRREGKDEYAFDGLMTLYALSMQMVGSSMNQS